MGIKTVVTYEVVDDLDGKTITTDDPDQHKIIFGWGGRRREIYLSDANKAKFEKAVTPYVEASKDITTLSAAPTTRRRRSSGSGGSTGSLAGVDKEQRAAIREWAKQNGWPKLGDRGRIPQEAVDAYNAK